MTGEEVGALSYEGLAVRQRMIGAEIDSLTSQFKQALIDVQELLRMDELSGELVERTKGRIESVTNCILYWTANFLEICSKSMATEAKAKIIAMRNTCDSERRIWTKALDRAVQEANAPPEESDSEESESEESLPEVTPVKETPKTARKKQKSSESRQTIKELQDQLRLMQIELEEARKLNRERLHNQQLEASFDRWAGLIVPTVPETRGQTLTITPKRVT